MIIGSFLDSSQVNGTVAPTGSYQYCYYHYDDVSVVAIGPAGIGEVRLNVFPLADGNLRLTGLTNGPLMAKVIDAEGSLIQEFRVTVVGGVANLRIGNLGMGLYVVTVWSREGRGSARFVWPGG